MEAAPLPLPPPTKAKRGKDDAPSVEPFRLRLVALIESTGAAYPDTTQVADRTNLKRVLATGITEQDIEAAYRAAYARGGWNPRISDVARVVTSANERPRGGNGVAPVSDFSNVAEGRSDFWETP
jgi:hypothetical protein